MARPKKPVEDEFDPFKPPPGSVPKDIELTPSERQAIEAEARKEVEDQLRARAVQKFKAEALNKARVDAGLAPQTYVEAPVRVRINVAEFAPNIIIDGRIYWHGLTYEVPTGVARTLFDIMYRTHGHQSEIEGKSRFEASQRVKAARLTPRGITTTQSLRA